ncbi:MAG TPA: MBL fold metallo-hydrolase, partial [Acidimicrobiales bacterium]
PAGRVRVVPTPGHTVGHQSVVVEGGGDEVVLAGDVLVHAVQVVDPDVPYALEHDRDEARRTRRALLAGAARRGALVGTAHLTAPLIELAAP